MPVRHSPPRSLAQRIMLSFALLVTFVAGFYAFALYQSIEFTEQQLISGILRDEVARAVDTLERGETPRLPEDTRLYGAPPLEAPPPTTVSYTHLRREARAWCRGRSLRAPSSPSGWSRR